MLKWFVPP